MIGPAIAFLMVGVFALMLFRHHPPAQGTTNPPTGTNSTIWTNTIWTNTVWTNIVTADTALALWDAKDYTNFLTITGRTYIAYGDSYTKVYFFHFTEAEWRLLTNYYREYYTGQMQFKFSGPITNAPKP